MSAAGAALRLLGDEASAAGIAEHARRLLPRAGRTDHRDAARAIAEEIARMPSPAEVARHLPDHSRG
ncbi:hypothetical protein [Micromonospora sp. 4G55]|uniref:hypothetical protein n=1 Tax=Micromonospora sp. 4G55 TaxID=2806102 RepID=UPI0035C73290